jgi:hypothetical protein
MVLRGWELRTLGEGGKEKERERERERDFLFFLKGLGRLLRS